VFLDFYHLHQQPFGVTPDPAYLYPSRTHCEALDSLTEGILGGRGFLALIAEPGMGKTTLLYQVLDGLHGSARAAFLFQTQCNSREFFQYLLSELGVDATGMGLVAMHNKLNEMLFAEMLAGRRFVLIVDEAQNLDESVLETIRLLSNFETSHTKLLQIVLAGQPQLREKLAQKQLSQLLQRIAVVNQLEAFSPEETAGYIRHRLKVAGHPEPLFEPEALALVAERSQGVPRNINKICFQALLEGYAPGRRTISAEIVDKADRKLRLVIDPRPESLQLPEREIAPALEPVFSIPAPAEAPSLAAAIMPPLTYKPFTKSAVPVWVLWVCAFAAVLLTVGFVLPRRTLKKLLHAVRGQAAAVVSLAGQADQARAASTPVQDPPAQSALDAKDISGAIPPGSNVSDPSPAPGPDSAAQDSLARELGLKISRIAIDPGHGGDDTGTVGPHGLLEKNLCLDVALRLGQLIQQNIPGAQVIYTRTDDRFVPLQARTEIANRANADVFISIHANSSDSREARGVETYYLSLAASPESMVLATRENALGQASLHDLPELLREIARNEKIEDSRQLAVDLQNSLSQRLQLVSRRETNRGVKRAPFIVLTGANMPAVLSEISFVSNASDESLLLGSGQRQRIAEGLYRGIADYLDSLHSLPRANPSLVSENHPAMPDGFAASAAALERNPQ